MMRESEKKQDLRLKKVLEKLKGKSEEEMTQTLVREGILIPVQKVKEEFSVTYTKKSLLKRIKERLGF